MRYAVYQLRKHPGRAHLHAIADSLSADQTIFDGHPKTSFWTPLTLRWVGNNLKPADVSTIFGPSALVISDTAREKLQPIFDTGKYEFLPVTCDRQTLYIVNVLEMVNCLREDKSNLVNECKSYQFSPHLFGASVFKIPQDPEGPILILEDSKNIENGFTYYIEAFGLAGLRFDLIWEGNDKRQLTDKKAATQVSPPPLIAPDHVQAQREGQTIVLCWNKIEGIDTYLIQWSRFPDNGFVTTSTVNCANRATTYIDVSPAPGTSYYRVFSYMGNTRYRSPPSPIAKVQF